MGLSLIVLLYRFHWFCGRDRSAVAPHQTACHYQNFSVCEPSEHRQL